ncbi:hypothetical protein Pecwa_1923 [Pectobacterium parmentieri WPP163]|nr:hypothetical protein Pecwa_1923 [Pectobacterium parmentieri WPP163]
MGRLLGRFKKIPLKRFKSLILLRHLCKLSTLLT